MSLSHHANGQRSRLLADALLHVGYSPDHVETDWKYSNYELMKKWIADDNPDNFPTNEAPASLDVAAFYDGKEHNWNTISLAAQLNRIDLVHDKERGHQEARRIFEDTASPCVLFAGNGTADLWLRCWDRPTPVKDITFEPQQLRKAFDQNRRELERDALATLRGGQRYLFDGFHLARREELATFLNRGITKATWFCDKLKCELDDDSEKALSRVAIGLLAARILEDKNIFGSSGEQSGNARELLDKADSLADGFFSHVIISDLALLDARISTRIVDEMLTRIMAHLTGPASFSMVTPEMLGDLYENLLRAQRKRGKDRELNGIHYTPLSLARNVLRRIPVEELPPARRYALDFACGSGTFLLAATERLRSVFDANEADSESELSDHLRSHVIGNDRDNVAILVANLTYLLEHVIETRHVQGVPVPDIGDKNALELTTEHFGLRSPSIIVGNPPFGRATDGHQLANKFLLKALDLLGPGGFLGMVMPGAFLKAMQRGGTTKTRRRLLTECELLEVWEMPLGAVGLSARQETCVIIARRKPRESDSRQPTLFNISYSSDLEAVRAQREHLRSTWTLMATGLPGRPLASWSEDTTARIIASPLDRVWRKIDFGRSVSAICDHTIGILTHLSKTSFSGQRDQGFVPYLRSQGRLHPYFLVESDWRKDPDNEHDYVNPDTANELRKYKRPLLHGPKLIVTGNTNRNARIQVKVAFDDAGVFPESNLYCLGLFNNSGSLSPWVKRLLSEFNRRDLLLWIAAVMNSPVGQAWVAMCSPPRSSPLDVFMSLPLPAYDPALPGLVGHTASLARTSDDFSELVNKINEEVLRSYGLTDADAADIQRYLDSLTKPWAESPAYAHLPQSRPYRRISGAVASIDVQGQRVTLDLPRYSRDTSGPIVLPLPRELPGWALREGVKFSCSVPADCRDVSELLSDPWILRDFRLVPYSYLDEDELEELLGFENPAPAH